MACRFVFTRSPPLPNFTSARVRPLIDHPVQRYRLADVVAGLPAPASVRENLETLLTRQLFYDAPLSAQAVRHLVATLSTCVERVNAATFTAPEALACLALTHAGLTAGTCRRRALRAYAHTLRSLFSLTDAFAVVHAVARPASERPVPVALHRLVRSLASQMPHPVAGLATGLAWLSGAVGHPADKREGLFSTATDDYATQATLTRRLQALVASETSAVTIDDAFLTALPLVPVWLTRPGALRPVPAFCLSPVLRRTVTNGIPLGPVHAVLDAIERPVGLTPAAACESCEAAGVAVRLPCALTRQVGGALRDALARIRTQTERNPSLASFFQVRHEGLVLGLFVPLHCVALPVPVWVDPLTAAGALCRPSEKRATALSEAVFVTRQWPGTGEPVTGVVINARREAEAEDDLTRARERAALRSVWAQMELEALAARSRRDESRARRRDKLPDTLLRPALTPAALRALARALPEPDCAWLASLTLVELAHHTLRLRRHTATKETLP